MAIALYARKSVEKANQLFTEIETENELAELFAVVENKAWWIEDDED